MYYDIYKTMDTQHYPPGTQEIYNSVSSRNLMMKNSNELESSEARGGGKGEPPVPPMDTITTFFSKKREYRSLSNFWEQDVIIIDDNCDKRLYQTGEHCFHGEKYIRLSQLCRDESRRLLLLNYGLKFKKPSLYSTSLVAKQMGGKRGLVLTSSELDLWNKISITVQKEICRFKRDNFQEVRDDLMKSGVSILIHPALRCRESDLKKRIWEGKAVIKDDGQITILGENRLGKIWMEIRNSE
jgi:predicted NAD-dependent protein-ADP-ribosyltransferase YbiA (DUF1768 family)